MLEIRGLAKDFSGVPALHPTDLKIQEGEFFSLLGPSGCGKTTLLRMLGGFERPTSGEIFLDGKQINLDSSDRRPFNMVFQRYALFPHLSVRDNIAFGPKMKRLPASEIQSRVDEALSLVKMQGFETRGIGTLSGGQQQRIALARAIVNRPRVLLLDEPLSALDLKLRQQMQVELLALQRRLKHTFIFVTHDQEEALTLSDRIAVMNAGRVEQLGNPREIYDRPKSRFVAGFIGTINSFLVEVFELDSKRALVKSISGTHWTVVDESGFGGLKVGEKARLMVRPEKMFVEGRSELLNQVEGEFLEILYQGPHTQLLMNASDEPARPVVAIRPGTEKEPPSGKMALSWKFEDAILLAAGASE
jgi:spermidine/putrescine transport system ATP-binding protein